MRTTVRLSEELLEQARIKAAEDGRTLTSLIEEGLRMVLNSKQSCKQEPFVMLVSDKKGGVKPGVNIENMASLLDIMEQS